jgi:hypothetical protein
MALSWECFLLTCIELDRLNLSGPILLDPRNVLLGLARRAASAPKAPAPPFAPLPGHFLRYFYTQPAHSVV